MEQNNNEQKHTKLATMVELGALALFIGAIVLVWIFAEKKPEVPPPLPPSSAPVPPAVSVEAGGLGAEISESVTNPTADKVPETNPFKQETNPLKDAYQNPFE